MHLCESAGQWSGMHGVTCHECLVRGPRDWRLLRDSASITRLRLQVSGFWELAGQEALVWSSPEPLVSWLGSSSISQACIVRSFLSVATTDKQAGTIDHWRKSWSISYILEPPT